MSQLYHNDMYQFDAPVKSYWEHVTNKRKKYDTLEKNVSSNIVVMGGGYTGISCAMQLAKEYQEDVILLEAGHIGWGSSARNAGFLCIPATKMSIEKMIKLHGIDETKKFVWYKSINGRYRYFSFYTAVCKCQSKMVRQ